MDTLGTQHFVLCREGVLFRRESILVRVLLVCPLLGGLSSFGVSGFTIFELACCD